MGHDIADEICSGCPYDALEYYPEADDYGQDPIGHVCQRDKAAGERCPRAWMWRDYYNAEKQKGAG